MSILGSKQKSISELEEESQQLDAELDVKRKRLLKRQLEAQGASIEAFKGADGRTAWDRVKNWLRSH